MKKTWILLSFIVLLILSMLYPATAENIKVYVDGKMIPFDQPPVMMNGTVMVPMRGVFEELGADVKWKSATQTIYAQKGTTEIILQIGSPFASVNGKTQQLTNPAAMVGGRTLVPLRFISEALGAEVKWNSTTQSVMITSGGATSQVTPTTSTEAPKIVKVSHNAQGHLQPGDVITITIEGDPGCNATFDIYGIREKVAMTEESHGKYSGKAKIPDNAGNIKNASVFGRLSRNGLESMRAAETGITITTNLIKILKVIPAEKSTVDTNRPNILIVFESTGETRIEKSTVSLYVNKKLVTEKAAISDELLSYIPEYDLPQGNNTILFTASDTSGNPIKKSWYFTVKTTGAIQSITHNATVPLAPGEVLQVKMQGDPGGSATFDIGTIRKNNPMAEIAPGIYGGNYKIQSEDSFQNAPVTGHLVLPGKVAVTLIATTPVSVKKELALQFTSPAPNSTVDKKFIITGMTSPFAKVSLDVRASLGGFFGLESKLVTTEVQANEAGNFQYELNDMFPVNGGTYTITGIARDSQGKQSKTITIKVNRK